MKRFRSLIVGSKSLIARFPEEFFTQRRKDRKDAKAGHMFPACPKDLTRLCVFATFAIFAENYLSRLSAPGSVSVKFDSSRAW